MAEPPYGVIWDAFKDGSVVPFLGAGCSSVGRDDNAIWTKPEDGFLPLGKDLANYLALEAALPSEDASDRHDLAKVSSYYEVVSGRTRLRNKLNQVFKRKYPSGALHEFLAGVPSHLLIIVTNYDTLLEQAFRDAGRPFDLVIYPSERKDIEGAVIWYPHGEEAPVVVPPNQLSINLEETTVIFKMHGSIAPNKADIDNYVITEEDYVEFLTRMTGSLAIPSIFYTHFRERSFLFLGYSLRDWNLRVVLKKLSKYISQRDDDDQIHSWAIQHELSELDKKLWEKRNVDIYKKSTDEFIRELRKRMND